MKFRELSVKEKKISIFNLFSLMIHIFFTPPLLSAEKIQQIKIVKTALLLQSNIPTVTDFKLSFGITLPQCGIIYVCQWKDSFCCLYSSWKKLGKALLSCSKKAEQNANPSLSSCTTAVCSHIPHHPLHWSEMWSWSGLNSLVTYFWWVIWTYFSSWSSYSWACINSCSSTRVSSSLEQERAIIFQWRP